MMSFKQHLQDNVDQIHLHIDKRIGVQFLRKELEWDKIRILVFYNLLKVTFDFEYKK